MTKRYEKYLTNHIWIFRENRKWHRSQIKNQSLTHPKYHTLHFHLSLDIVSSWALKTILCSAQAAWIPAWSQPPWWSCRKRLVSPTRFRPSQLAWKAARTWQLPARFYALNLSGHCKILSDYLKLETILIEKSSLTCSSPAVNKQVNILLEKVNNNKV